MPSLFDNTPTPTGTESRLCSDVAHRQVFGLNKYGISIEDNPETLRGWLKHAYLETVDKAIYLRRAIEELDRKEGIAPAPIHQ